MAKRAPKTAWTSETAPRDGNPQAGKRAALLAALMSCATPADFARLGRKWLKAGELALDAGDAAVIDKLCDRLLGKPAQSVSVEASESLQSILERLAANKAAGEQGPPA